jgi:hypothetical protein
MQTKAENILNPYRFYLSEGIKKRLRWLYILYYECRGNVSTASNKIGISRQWLSTIKSCFERHSKDPRCLEPSSKAPHHTTNRERISEITEEKIIEIRETYHWGKEKISTVLDRDHGLKAHPTTVNRYLHKHLLIDPKISERNKKAYQEKKKREELSNLQNLNLKVKFRPPKQIKDYVPGALIEKDMKLVPKIGQFADYEKYRAKENFWYQHTEIDSFTRIRTLQLVEDSDSTMATTAHREVIKRLPFTMACMNTDSGGENEKDFSKELQQSDVFHFYSRTGTPTDNPRVERSHLTDDQEFYGKGNIHKTFEEQREALKDWEDTYNFKRPHQALGNLTPMEFYQLWKENSNKAYAITRKYQAYLAKQRKRQTNARRIKRKEQIDKLMQFIDAKLNQQKVDLKLYKLQLVKCQLCS